MRLANSTGNERAGDTIARPPCTGRPAAGVFRLTIHDTAAEFRLAAEGRVTVAGAAEMERCWRTAASTVAQRRFVIDTGGAASIDEDARSILERLRNEGARWIAARPRMSLRDALLCLVNRLRFWTCANCAD